MFVGCIAKSDVESVLNSGKNGNSGDLGCLDVKKLSLDYF